MGPDTDTTLKAFLSLSLCVLVAFPIDRFYLLLYLLKIEAHDVTTRFSFFRKSDQQ